VLLAIYTRQHRDSNTEIRGLIGILALLLQRAHASLSQS